MKRKLTLKENIYLVKRKLIDSIYSSAKIERINVTFPETKVILEGGITGNGNIPISDIEKVLNLRNAWRFVLKTIEAPLNLHYACQVNRLVSNNEALYPGEFRTGEVGIGGTNYKPGIPDIKNTEKDINIIFNETDTKLKAIKYFLYACRTQFFWDGNKRTASICCNKLLIQSGDGIMIIPPDKITEFDTTMIEFYETNDYEKSIPYFLDKIETIEFAPNKDNSIIEK